MDSVVNEIVKRLKRDHLIDEGANIVILQRQILGWLPTIDEDEIVLHGYEQTYEWFVSDFNLA